MYDLKVFLFSAVLLSVVDTKPLKFEPSAAPAGFLTKSLTKDLFSASSLGMSPAETEILGPLLTLLQIGGDSLMDSLLTGLKNICNVLTTKEDKKTLSAMASAIQDPLSIPLLSDILGGKPKDSGCGDSCDSNKKSKESEKSSSDETSSSSSKDSSSTTDA